MRGWRERFAVTLICVVITLGSTFGIAAAMNWSPKSAAPWWSLLWIGTNAHRALK